MFGAGRPKLAQSTLVDFSYPRSYLSSLYPAVTENPFVGNLVRDPDTSGVPIADRPILLLKGSGRVNRILDPDEDLTGALAKSVRLARRQRGGTPQHRSPLDTFSRAQSGSQRKHRRRMSQR